MVKCQASGNGFRPTLLERLLPQLRHFLPHNFKIECAVLQTDTPEPYEVYWKVKNVGPEAERRNEVRGQIIKRGPEITENTKFFGNHYIECYIIKDKVCVARKRINIPIGRG